MSAAMRCLLGTQEQVRNRRGKRAVSVRATEVLLYFFVGGASNRGGASKRYDGCSICYNSFSPGRETEKAILVVA